VTRQEIERQRQGAIAGARAILDKIKSQGRDSTDTEERQWNLYMAEADRLKTLIPDSVVGRGAADFAASENASQASSAILSGVPRACAEPLSRS
jgi:hypothetical protein